MVASGERCGLVLLGVSPMLERRGLGGGSAGWQVEKPKCRAVYMP